MSETRTRVPFGIQIADDIRMQISAGKLRPGDELPSESDLAEQFQVSQRVVRDALRTLNGEGIIATRQGKRAVVRDFKPVAVGNYLRFVLDADARAIDELMEFREFLESHAARLAAQRANPQEVAAMRRAAEQIAAASDELEVRVPADLELHDLIARASGNRFLHGMLSALADTLAEERRRGAEITQSAGGGHSENDARHSALVEAIASGEVERAAECAADIVGRARDVWRADREKAGSRRD